MHITRIISLIVALLIFGIITGIFIKEVFGLSGQDCQSIQTNSINGTWNKSFINCLTEPILNITNVSNVTVLSPINIVNFTFNDTTIANAIQNQTSLLTDITNKVSILNFTNARLLDENIRLMAENGIYKSQNPSYDTLKSLYASALSNFTLATQEINNEKGNKPIYIIGGALVSFVIFTFINQRQNQPEEMLFPSGGRTKGEAEPIKQSDIDDAINKKIKQLNG